jgi:hypothetical protein
MEENHTPAHLVAQLLLGCAEHWGGHQHLLTSTTPSPQPALWQNVASSMWHPPPSRRKQVGLTSQHRWCAIRSWAAAKSRTCSRLHSRSATASARGHSTWRRFDWSTYSPHRQALPPSTSDLALAVPVKLRGSAL